MINPNLYKKAVAVDATQHRSLRLAHGVRDWRVAADLNALFIASAEFGDACCEYPIVFIEAGTEEGSDKKLIAPIVVFGLSDKQNLYIQPNGQWRAHYIPALLRAYPFGVARQDMEHVLVVMEEGFEGWSQTEGQALFDGEGKPTEFMTGVRDQLERIEIEVQRTRMFGNVLRDNDLLTTMRFDATTPDGKTITVDGFMTVDEKKFADLPDAKVVELHRNGVLGLIHAHQISMRHMRRLVEWLVERNPASQPAATAATKA